MSNFSFPPPPPPPARAGPDVAVQPFTRGDRGGWPGSRGRGRDSLSRGGRGGGECRPSHQNSGHGAVSGRGRGNRGSRGEESFRGQKRKRDDFHSGSKPHSRPKVEAAPAVPSFGAPLPSLSSSFTPPVALGPKAVVVATTKKKSNQLGLTPLVDYGDESDDDEGKDDEAMMLASSRNPLHVEFNGKTTDLGSPSEMAAWLAERRAKWPTKARVAERKREELKKEQEMLRRRLEAGKARKAVEQELRMQEADVSQQDTPPIERDLSLSARDAKAKKSLEKHLAKVEKLKLKLEKSEARAARAGRQTQESLEGLGGVNSATVDAPVVDMIHTVGEESTVQPLENGPTIEAAENSAILDDGTTTPSSSSSDEDSSDSDDESDAVGPPEAISSRMQTNHASEEHHPSTARVPQLCHQFAAGGRCPRGKRCHFKHERPEGSERKPQKAVQMPPSKRKTLYQRLVEQEIEAENRQALELINYMGDNGYLDSSSGTQ